MLSFIAATLCQIDTKAFNCFMPEVVFPIPYYPIKLEIRIHAVVCGQI